MAGQTVPFETMGQPEFDRVVEALLVTEFTGGGFTAQALDGRGGDGGIDIGVRDPQGKVIRIFQLKYFPEGFSGLHGRRRQQVKDSFNTAWENHQPPRWTLVLPRNPTREEQDYVLRLAAGHHVQVDIFGRAELDNLLGKHPHLLDYFAKDRALELLTAVHRPEEALTHRDDIGVVLDRVHSGTDAQSPHWGWGYQVDVHGNQLHYLVAKHPDAHLAEPLFVDMKATFSAATEDLHDQLDRARRFGVAETIVLPNSVVPSIVHRGPDWFAGEKKVTEVHLVPSDTGAGTPVTLVAEDANGVQLGSIPGTVKRFTQGGEGGQLIVDFIGGLTAHWVIPTADDAPPQDVTFVTGSAGAPVREVRRLTRFMSRFDDARRAIVRVKGQEFLAFNLGGGDRHTPDPAFVAFLEDLVAIEDALDVEFMFPEKGVSNSDRRWAATFREVLRGNAAPMPSVDGYNITLDGGYDETLLAQLRSDAGRWFARKPHFTHELLGVDIVITDICIYQHEATVVGGDEHAKALIAGQGQGRRVHVASEKNLPWLLCKPDLIPAHLDSPELVGWSVPGVDEHPGLAALRKMLPALEVTPLRRQA